MTDAIPPLPAGQPAPDARLKTLDGCDVSLAAAWRDGRHALLVFLRHPG